MKLSQQISNYKRVQSLEMLCLIRLVNLIEKSGNIENQINFIKNLNGNLSIKLFSMLLRRGLLNDQLLNAILKSVNIIERHYLKELNLIETANKITNNGFDILIKKFSSNLRILILNSNKKQAKNFTDTFSLFTIAKYCTNLLHLELKNCPLIEDPGVREICINCKLLEKLNCAGCINLSNLSLESASELKYLKSINFSQTIINDHGIQMFLNKIIDNGRLEEIIFNSCKFITQISIDSIFQASLNLKCLSFNDCPNIDCLEFSNFDRKSLKEIVWTFH